MHVLVHQRVGRAGAAGRGARPVRDRARLPQPPWPAGGAHRPPLARAGVDVLRQQAMAVAAGEHGLEQGARLVPLPQRGQRVDVPERAYEERVVRFAEVVLFDVPEDEVAALQLAPDGPNGGGESGIVVAEEAQLVQPQQAGIEYLTVERGREAVAFRAPGALLDHLVDASRLLAPIRGPVGEAEVGGDA